MQLAGLLFPDLRPRGRARTVLEKVQQMRYAAAIESAWSKEQILEAYLNLAPFRGESEGLASCARLSFGKDVSGLTPAEALITTVLLRAPNARSDALAERACRLRTVMVDLDTAFQHLAGCDELAALTARVTTNGVVEDSRVRYEGAPQVGRVLARRVGDKRDVRSTIDLALQRFVAEQLRTQLATLASQRVSDGAALVVSNRTGEVLSYVGNGGRFSSARHVDGVRAKRQAGSTLKPFLYALALERRLLTADTRIDDAPLEIPVGGGIYRPRNYDDRFHGPVTVRTALASSLNIPAVATVQRAGVAPFVELLGRLGVSELASADEYGPSVALGSPVVSLWELVNAYRTLARGGEYGTLTLLAHESAAGGRRVIDGRSAHIISDVLSDRVARSTTFGLENVLATPYWTAVKTGTSKDMTDNWCLGYSADYTVGVWVGNFSGEPMRDVSGVTGAAPLWARIFDYLAARPGFNPAPPEMPADLVVRGTLAGRELYLPGTEPPGSGVGEVTRAVAMNQPVRILSPLDETLFAIDPDMPPAVQRVPFEAIGTAPGTMWYLGDVALGPAQVIQWWEPLPGRHEATLRAPDGAILARTHLIVRGEPRAGSSQ
jgi:penicillin-binding protein 1C